LGSGPHVYEAEGKLPQWDRLLNGSNFSEEKQSRHLRTDLNADGSR
jgi:hypothetical protein